MSDTSSLLDRVQIAKPCPARWEDMLGDERVRRCDLCTLDVYDVSAMRREEAESFLRERTGRTCIRLWKREDGTVITSDCPVGVRAAWKRVVLAASALVGVALTVASMMTPRSSAGAAPSSSIGRAIAAPPDPPRVLGEMAAPEPGTRAVMGDVAIPPARGSVEVKGEILITK
jgi:hypothetical protein